MHSQSSFLSLLVVFEFNSWMQKILCRKSSQDTRQGNPHSAAGEKKIVQERDGRLKNLLKKTYLRNWVGNDSERNNPEALLRYEGIFNQRQSSHKMDFARFTTVLGLLLHYLSCDFMYLDDIDHRLL